MKKIRYVCDRCKKEVESIPRRYKLGIQKKTRFRIALFKAWPVPDPYDTARYDELDLCEECRADLDRWLRGDQQ